MRQAQRDRLHRPRRESSLPRGHPSSFSRESSRELIDEGKSGVAYLETLQVPPVLLPCHIDLIHPGARRTCVAPLDRLLDHFPVSFEERLHSSVIEVLHPPVETETARKISGKRPVVYPLDRPADKEMRPHLLHGLIITGKNDRKLRVLSVTPSVGFGLNRYRRMAFHREGGRKI